MSSEIFNLLDEIEEEKGISRDVVLDALKGALISAYKKNFGAASDIDVIFSEEGEIKICAIKKIVEEVEDREAEISLEDALKLPEKDRPIVIVRDGVETDVRDPKKWEKTGCQVDDILKFEFTPKAFGRIAAQTARQVVFQRIREAEREKMVDEYSSRENNIVDAVVRKIDRRNVMLEIDGNESVLMSNEQVKHDNYRVGEHYKVFVVEIADSIKGARLVVSRSHPGLVRCLFELEVPEISQGIIEFKGISREAGSRSKIAVASTEKNVDPVGTCIGPGGTRVQNVINELRGEKIDIIRYSDDPAEFVSNALSPAKVLSINVFPGEKMCKVVVPESQLSLAIGREGQNVRLAARLTGWKIDLSASSENRSKRPEETSEADMENEVAEILEKTD